MGRQRQTEPFGQLIEDLVANGIRETGENRVGDEFGNAGGEIPSCDEASGERHEGGAEEHERGIVACQGDAGAVH